MCKWYADKKLSIYEQTAYSDWDELPVEDIEKILDDCLHPTTLTLYNPPLSVIAEVLEEYISGRKKAEFSYREYERIY